MYYIISRIQLIDVSGQRPLDLDPGLAASPKFQVFEVVREKFLHEVFGLFGVNLDVLCWTDRQVESFVEKHRMWLLDEGSGAFPGNTFFLGKDGNQFVVIRVYEVAGKFYSNKKLLRTGDDAVLIPPDLVRVRVVVPSS